MDVARAGQLLFICYLAANFANWNVYVCVFFVFEMHCCCCESRSRLLWPWAQVCAWWREHHQYTFTHSQVFIYRNVGCGSAGTRTRCWKYVEKLAPDTLKELFTKNEHHLLSFNHPHFAPDFLFSVEDKKRENVLAALFSCDAYEWRLGLLSSNKALKMFQKSFVLVTTDFHCTYENKKFF